VREPSIVAVGWTDWDSPPADVLQLLNSATSTEEDQDVGISRVHMCHTPFRERGNEASICVPRMFKSHVQ
jgi:hypothetical protein